MEINFMMALFHNDTLFERCNFLRARPPSRNQYLSDYDNYHQE